MANKDIKNGHARTAPELASDVVKSVVVGEPQVGKTKFIRAFYEHHEPAEIFSENGVRVYLYEYLMDGEYGRAAIFEIPGAPDFFEELRIPRYEDAMAVVTMYAIDNPLSLQLLTDKWLPEFTYIVSSKGIPVMLVGNKTDLRDDPQVIEHLALNGEAPVTPDQGSELLVRGEVTEFSEISTLVLGEVNAAFDTILKLAQFKYISTLSDD